MAKGSYSVHIARSADDVFAFVSEVENNPRWHDYVIETSWLDDGPMRVGRRGRQVSRILGLRYAIVAEVLEWDPPRSVTWQTVAGGATVRTNCLVEAEAGGCRITMSAEGTFTKGLLRLLSPISVRVFRRQATNDLKKLAVVLGSRAELRQ
jgi:uncharacterized membrane protein